MTISSITHTCEIVYLLMFATFKFTDAFDDNDSIDSLDGVMLHSVQDVVEVLSNNFLSAVRTLDLIAMMIAWAFVPCRVNWEAMEAYDALDAQEAVALVQGYMAADHSSLKDIHKECCCWLEALEAAIHDLC